MGNISLNRINNNTCTASSTSSSTITQVTNNNVADVAVLSATIPIYAIVNSITTIQGMVANYGTQDEFVDISLKVEGIVIDTITILIESGNTQMVTFLWNPTYAEYLNISIMASVPNDINPSNNIKGSYCMVFTARGVVLLVDDDEVDNYETYYQDALMASGYLYQYWNRGTQGCPPAATMSQYNAVVWFTGDDSSTTLVTEDITTLTAYLNGGGRLFLTGQDIGYDIHTDNFYANYLHATYLVDDTGVYTLLGQTGDPIGDGMTIVISAGDGANNQNYPSGIQSIAPATEVFYYQGTSYSGCIRVDTGTYKVVYFAFGFEAINTMGDRTEVMNRTIEWLAGTDIPTLPDIWINPMNLDYVTAPGSTITDILTIGNDPAATSTLTFNTTFLHGYTLQWVHNHGGSGHSQLAQPVGDIDEDGINEFLIGGYGSGCTYIYSYDPVQKTYVQEYSWTYSGGYYNVPSGACVVDLDDNGDLEFVVSWEYSGQDGIHAYDWDGTTLTELDWYTGTGYNFAFDVYACDYDDDNDVEVLIANDIGGGGSYHVTALGWNSSTNKFVQECSWGSGQATECPMVWSGDPDNDGKTEVIAAAGVNTVYALNYNNGTWTPVTVATSLPAHPYGVACGDLDNDGIDEIGIGLENTDAYIYEWTGSSYAQVWHHNYAGEEGIIEGIAIGDADNDDQLEFLIAPTDIHVVKWNGTGYEEVAVMEETEGMIAGLTVGDFDTDGNNETKACDINSDIGKEWIFDYVPKPDWITLTPSGGVNIAPGSIVNISLEINTTEFTENLTHLFITVESDDPDESQVQIPVYVSMGFNQFSMPLYFGWNLITFPVDNTWTAETLGRNISGCSVVVMFNSSTQTFLTHVVGTPHDDFPIMDGMGYFVYCIQDSILSIPDVSITSITAHIYEEWNIVGWYHEYSTTAESLGENISGTSAVSMFDPVTQTFITHVVGVPHDNFTIERGMGLFIYTDEESYWYGEG